MPLTPQPILRAFGAIRLASRVVSSKKSGDIKITLLLPDNPQHRADFQKIVTNENIIFTSSWMDKWFGLSKIKSFTDKFSVKLDLVTSGDQDVTLPEAALQQIRSGLSPVQVGLNLFFKSKDNENKLHEIYAALTSKAVKTGLGYFKFENNDDSLIGGGALAPLSDGDKVAKVDVALHILDQKKGLGSTCLSILLEEAFEKHDIQEVVGSSLREHKVTPAICAKHGMIIINDQNLDIKVYYMDRDMWKASKGKLEKLEEKSTDVAATRYGR